MTNSGELSPALMVRTFPLFYEEELTDSVAQTIQQAMGERAVTIVSPTYERQISTAVALQHAINRGMGDNNQATQDFSISEVLESTQFKTSPDAARQILTQAAIRGIWSPEADNGLVIVTSEYPILGALRASQKELGLQSYETTSEIDAGQVVEIDLDAIGYVTPEVTLPQSTNLDRLAIQSLSAGNNSKLLDIFRRKRHN